MLVVTAAGESPLCQISCLHQLCECVVLIATVLHVPAAVVAVATPVCVIGTVVSPCPAQALPSVRRREWRGAAAPDAPTSASDSIKPMCICRGDQVGPGTEQRPWSSWSGHISSVYRWRLSCCCVVSVCYGVGMWFSHPVGCGVDDPGYLPSLKLVEGHPLSAIIADGTFPAGPKNSFAALYYKLGMCKDDEVCCFTAGQVLGGVDGKTKGEPNTAVHLVDPSATGKTRALYEGLAKRYGMLLVCGEGDEYMRMTDVSWGLAQAPEQPDARALHFAKVVTSALLARFVVLRHMLKQLGRDAFTPSDWLRTQLRGDVGAGAMLQALSLKLQGSRFSFSFLVGRLVLEALHVTRQAHGTNTVAMPIVIDEAQQLCKLPNVAHLQEVIMQAGEDATSRCTALEVFAEVIHRHLVVSFWGRFVPVICGTSFHLLDQNEYDGGSCPGLAKPSTGPVAHLLQPLPRFTTVSSFKICVASLGFGAVVDVITNEMWEFAVGELQSRGRFIAALLKEMCKWSPALDEGAQLGVGAGGGAAAGGGGGDESKLRDDDASCSASDSDVAMARSAGGGGDAPPHLNATVVNAMFGEAAIRARDVILQSRMVIQLTKKFNDGAINVSRGVVCTEEARLHQALCQIATFAYMDASSQGDKLEFFVRWENHYGERRAGKSVGADLLAAGVAVPLDDVLDTCGVHVCEPIVILAVLKIVPPEMIIDKVLASWRSVAFISLSVNAYMYKLVLCDCFKRLFAAKDVADIPGLNASRWAQKFPGRWRLPDEGVLCGRVPALDSLDEWLHADCHPGPGTTFVLPHENDGPDIAMFRRPSRQRPAQQWRQ